jgi:hypothetical protein
MTDETTVNQKLLWMLHGSRGPQGMGDLLKMVFLQRVFSITPPAPVTCPCHLGQKKAPLAKKFFLLHLFAISYINLVME